MVDLPFAPGVERSALDGGLFAGDAAVIALLLAGGMMRHHENPLAMPERVVLVVGPFLVAWAVAAVLTGAYTERARTSVAGAMATGAWTWLLATVGGAALRATAVFPGQSPATFVAVVAGFGAVAVALWRGLVTAAVGPAGR